MTGKRISRQKLNNAIKALPIPVQEHCKRCKLIAGYLVDLIRLEDWFLDAGLNPDHIVSAVYLHDVGKCAIPRDNLYAEHNETAAKKKVYRSHIEEGVRFVERECDLKFDSFGDRAFERYVYAAITEHHEQADGCGFPRALRTEAMTVVGKIAAIADTLDNMLFVGTTEGAQEVGVASAVEALEGMAGRELDRDLVKALTRDKTALCGFLEYIDTRNQNKRKRDAYGLQLSFSSICNIQENRKVDYDVTFVINDPYWGIIRPEVFWPVAEHTGQLLRLTKLAVERVCITCDLVADRHGEYPHVSVPVASACLANKTFVPDLCKLPSKYNLRKGSICLVIDGITAEDDPEAYLLAITDLREAGYRVAINSMKDGSTLLSSIDRLPVDALFVDAAYTARIVSNENTYGVASGMLDIAHNLNMRAIFLGVDNRRLENELLKMTARYASGDLYGESLREHDFISRYGGDEM